LEALEKFFMMLSSDVDRVAYGPKACKYALEADAINTLLVSDQLFRSTNA
jgi:protein pelota